MVLSDHTIREEIAAGRIVVDPFDDALVQPCSIDVRVGEKFRVFRNSRYPYIDVKQPMEDLTELVTVADDEALWAHKLGLEARCRYVGGDMFKAVPKADASGLKMSGKGEHQADEGEPMITGQGLG